MGLHVWYSLVLPPPVTFDDAVAKITRLYDFAKKVGFTGDDDIPAVANIEVGAATDDQPERRIVEIKSHNGASRTRSRIGDLGAICG
jgi:hypothetical protein